MAVEETKNFATAACCIDYRQSSSHCLAEGAIVHRSEDFMVP